jgi:hypothetical protein
MENDRISLTTPNGYRWGFTTGLFVGMTAALPFLDRPWLTLVFSALTLWLLWQDYREGLRLRPLMLAAADRSTVR